MHHRRERFMHGKFQITNYTKCLVPGGSPIVKDKWKGNPFIFCSQVLHAGRIRYRTNTNQSNRININAENRWNPFSNVFRTM